MKYTNWILLVSLEIFRCPALIASLWKAWHNNLSTPQNYIGFFTWDCLS